MLKKGGSDSGNTINLKLVSQKGPNADTAPVFAREVNNDGNYEIDLDQSYDEVSGVIKSIKTTHNGKSGNDEVKGFRLYIEDEGSGEVYRVESTMKQASKDIVNSALASIGQFLTIRMYLNKAGYPTASIKKEDGSFSDVKYPFDPAKPLDLAVLWSDIEAQEPVDPENTPF